MTRLFSILAGVAVVGLIAVTYLLTQANRGDDQFAQCRAGQVAGGTSQIGGPFTLVSETGETMTEAEVIDQPVLIYFGYTFCPDACSIDTARNATAVDILEESGTIVKPVFISIDPARDTVDVVRGFTEAFHPRMLGLTGSEEQVKAASQAYRTYYSKQDGDPEFYLVDHTTLTYLSLPEHGFVEFFRNTDTPEAMAARVQCFVDAA